MVDIVIQGIYGRMGQTLVKMIDGRPDCQLVAGIDTIAKHDVFCPVFEAAQGLDTLEQKPDVVIDFSLPIASLALLDYCVKNNLPCVICTTGLDDEAKEKIYYASKKTSVFYSANMSVGISLLCQLVKRAQTVLNGFDVEIVEKHHHNKLDAPSGTALMLANAVNEVADGRYNYMYNRHELRQKRSVNEIGIHAVRGGNIVGEHEVIFAGEDEVISLSHSACSRDVFASGAITAALYLAGKMPGLYNMDSLLKDI